MRRNRALAVALLALLIAPTVAGAEAFLLRPGFNGQDTAYYSFIPLLVRGQYSTMYAQTATDEDGESHSMKTYLRFDLPEDLLQPGETVTGAYLTMVYAFSFDHFGDPADIKAKVYVHQVLEPWDEDSLNYANRPAIGSPVDKLKKIGEFGNLEFDVTETVRLWAHEMAPNYGFALSNPTERPVGFHSWESGVSEGLRNALVIVTGPGSPPSTGKCKACGREVSIASEDTLTLGDSVVASAPLEWDIRFDDRRFTLDDGNGGLYSGTFSESGKGKRKIELVLDAISRAALLDTWGDRLGAVAGEEIVVTEVEPISFSAKLNKKKTRAHIKLKSKLQSRSEDDVITQGRFKLENRGKWLKQAAE